MEFVESALSSAAVFSALGVLSSLFASELGGVFPCAHFRADIRHYNGHAHARRSARSTIAARHGTQIQTVYGSAIIDEAGKWHQE